MMLQQEAPWFHSAKNSVCSRKEQRQDALNDMDKWKSAMFATHISPHVDCWQLDGLQSCSNGQTGYPGSPLFIQMWFREMIFGGKFHLFAVHSIPSEPH